MVLQAITEILVVLPLGIFQIHSKTARLVAGCYDPFFAENHVADVEIFKKGEEATSVSEILTVVGICEIYRGQGGREGGGHIVDTLS